MELNQLHSTKGARKTRKRVGRGPGSGHGKTSCRGHKGQKARAGGSINPVFEGGQMPLVRRLPKFGFTNVGRIATLVVNLHDLDRFDAGTSVNEDLLRKAGLVKGRGKYRIKILGKGSLAKALTVSAHAFSDSAKAAIEKAGGKVELIARRVVETKETPEATK